MVLDETRRLTSDDQLSSGSYPRISNDDRTFTLWFNIPATLLKRSWWTYSPTGELSRRSAPSSGYETRAQIRW